MCLLEHLCSIAILLAVCSCVNKVRVLLWLSLFLYCALGEQPTITTRSQIRKEHTLTERVTVLYFWYYVWLLACFEFEINAFWQISIVFSFNTNKEHLTYNMSNNILASAVREILWHTLTHQTCMIVPFSYDISLAILQYQLTCFCKNWWSLTLEQIHENP